MTRLQFGNPEHIDLVAQAHELMAEYRSIAAGVSLVLQRVWYKPGPSCAACKVAVQRDDLFIRVGRDVYHERCVVAKIIGIRRRLTALGFEKELA